MAAPWRHGSDPTWRTWLPVCWRFQIVFTIISGRKCEIQPRIAALRVEKNEVNETKIISCDCRGGGRRKSKRTERIGVLGPVAEESGSARVEMEGYRRRCCFLPNVLYYAGQCIIHARGRKRRARYVFCVVMHYLCPQTPVIESGESFDRFSGRLRSFGARCERCPSSFRLPKSEESDPGGRIKKFGGEREQRLCGLRSRQWLNARIMRSN